MNDTIPLQQIDEVCVSTSDLVAAFKKPSVLRYIATEQLKSVQGSIVVELERRSKTRAA
jgi:hypothetical protein